MSTCQGCGTPLQQPRRGRRKWCSERCRKVTLYASRCLDCDAITNVDGRVTNPNYRCAKCNAVHTRAESRKWILESFAEWHHMFGVPPVAADWNPSRCRMMTKRPDDYYGRTLARNESTGRRWPVVSLVLLHFGTWNDAVRVAGFVPLTPSEHWIGRRKIELRRAAVVA